MALDQLHTVKINKAVFQDKEQTLQLDLAQKTKFGDTTTDKIEAQFPYQERPAASTTNVVGPTENGLSIRSSVSPESSTSAWASCNLRQPARTEPASAPSPTSAAISIADGARPSSTKRR